MWHKTCDRWREVNLCSKVQFPSSFGLGVMLCWRFFGYMTVDVLVTPGHFRSLDHLVTQSLCHSFIWSLVTSFTPMPVGHLGMTSGNMIQWPNNQVTKWPSDQVTEWPSNLVTEWPSKGVTVWLNDRKWLSNKPGLQATGAEDNDQTVCRAAPGFVLVCLRPRGQFFEN